MGFRVKSEVGAISFSGEGEGLKTHSAGTTPGRKAMTGKERRAMSQPLRCHLKKSWHSLSRLSQSCFGRRGPLQKLPGLVVLRGVTHQAMNLQQAGPPTVTSTVFYECICLLTARLSYWGLSREEQCLKTVGGISHSTYMHWIWTVHPGSLVSHL